MACRRLIALLLAGLAILAPAHPVRPPNARASAAMPYSGGSDWMGNLGPRIGGLPLDQIVMPGSHDTGSFSIPAVGQVFSAPSGAQSPEAADPSDPVSMLQAILPPALLLRLGGPWSRAQELDIPAQLSAGVRYFDLHVCAGPAAHPGLYACHGLYGAPIRTAVLDPAARFLAAHPKEILILDFHHFAAPGSPGGMTVALHEQLASQIHAAFPGMLLAPGPRRGAITLGDVWRTSRRVIVLYNDGPTVQANPDFWPYADTIVAWPATHNLGVLQQRVKRNLLCRCDALHAVGADSAAFFDLQLQMTPNGSMYLAGTLGPARVRSLRDLAASNIPMLAYLKGLVVDPSSRTRAHLNVITTDFSDLPALLPFAEALDAQPAS